MVTVEPFGKDEMVWEIKSSGLCLRTENNKGDEPWEAESNPDKESTNICSVYHSRPGLWAERKLSNVVTLSFVTCDGQQVWTLPDLHQSGDTIHSKFLEWQQHAVLGQPSSLWQWPGPLCARCQPREIAEAPTPQALFFGSSSEILTVASLNKATS